MTPGELREEIAIELESIAQVVAELNALYQDVGETPTVREKTAAAAFLAQFYNGIENILKRINYFNGKSLPTSSAWHVELFQQFTYPTDSRSSLFDTDLAAQLAPYRRFRHVAFHGYGFQLDWHRMAEGIANVESVFAAFSKRLAVYLDELT